MEAGSEKLLESEPPQSRFDWLIQWLMAALLAFMPFALGAVSRWAEEIVFIISGAMVICLLLKLIVRPNERFIWSWAYVPLGLFLLLVAFQLIPMPAGILAAITPSTVAIKTSLLSGLSEGTRTNPAMTVSFYSLPTERALRLALAVAGVFVVTVNVCRRDSQIQRLLATVVVIGAAAALLALAQRATNTQKIYWRIPARTMAGPFVNRNNYCQFMNLSVGAAIGLLLFRIKTAFRGTPVVLSRVVERLGVRELKPAWWLSGMIVLALASIFLSLSRGGMISLLIAWGATIAVLALKRRLQASGWIMCILAAGAFACVLYVSFDSIYERFASLGRLQEYGGRWQLLRDSTRAWSTFPLFGAGLGLHEYIHPMFDNSTILAAASHAENEYVQMAEETGIVGLLLIGAFGAVILRSYIRCLRHKRGSAGLLAVGLSAGLLAVIVHSVSDFGLHLPANACLAAVFCGLLVTIARAGRLPDEPTDRGGAKARGLTIVCLVAVIAVGAWTVTGAEAARRAEACWREAQRLEKSMREESWAVANDDYAKLIELTGKAVEHEPGNVLYRHWLNAHRYRSVSRVTDPKTGSVVLSPVALQSLEEMIADLERACILCPTFGPSHSLAGQLRWFVLNDTGGVELIRRGRVLAPCDPASCFADGMLDAHLHNFDASLATFRRVLALSGRWFHRIVRVYMFQVGRPDLAVEIASDHVSHLLAVAKMLDEENNGALAAEARAEAETLLRAQCEMPRASARMLARAGEMCSQRQEHDSAAAYYRRALFLECGNVMWRLRFAEALAAMGQISRARQQAAICLKLKPGMPGAVCLISDLRGPPVGG